MVQALPNMPAGTVGFDLDGRITAEDYRDLLVPALRTAVESGSVRVVIAVGPEYEGFELSAVKADLEGLVPLALEHRAAWRRIAAVTDVEWIAKAVEMFRWLMPGEVRVFGFDELALAKLWVAE